MVHTALLDIWDTTKISNLSIMEIEFKDTETVSTTSQQKIPRVRQRNGYADRGR